MEIVSDVLQIVACAAIALLIFWGSGGGGPDGYS